MRIYVATIGPVVLFVNFPAMRDPRYAHQLGRIVDDVQHAPVTDADAPLILVAFQLLASCGPWMLAQKFQFADDARKHVIRQGFEFLPRGRFYLDGIIIHAADRV
jgi:hypothetical protein